MSVACYSPSTPIAAPRRSPLSNATDIYDLVISLRCRHVSRLACKTASGHPWPLMCAWSAVQGEIDILIALVLRHFRAKPWRWCKPAPGASRRKLHFGHHEPGKGVMIDVDLYLLPLPMQGIPGLSESAACGCPPKCLELVLCQLDLDLIAYKPSLALHGLEELPVGLPQAHFRPISGNGDVPLDHFLTLVS